MNTADALDAPDPREQALARLARSREALLVQLLPPPPLATDGPRWRGGRWWRWLRRRTLGVPAVALAMDALGTWWRRHPWRPAGELALREVQTHVAPVVRRHPVATAVGLATLGAGLWWLRPWQWSPVARELHQLPHRGWRWLGGVAGQLPLSLLVAQWLSQRDMAQHPQTSPADADPEAATASPEPMPNTAPQEMPHE